MSLPPDLSNLLAVAIRDVIWFKDRVLSFLKACDVPPPILIEARRLVTDNVPTIKIIHYVLEQLESRGGEGTIVARRMLTNMHRWNDLHSTPPDRKDKAAASLRELQQAVRRFQAQEDYRKSQDAEERAMHHQRIERSKLSELDHAKLRGFRLRFDEVFLIADRQDRGNRFQDLMNDIFDYYCEDSRGDFRRTGEQIDGQFYFDKHWYYVEIRWRESKASAADISVLRDRARSAFGGDTKALFVSFNGFTSECLESLARQSGERVVLMDGADFYYVLDGRIGFDVLLAEKQAEIVRSGRPFVSAQDVITKRSNR